MVPLGSKRLALIEAKATRTPTPAMVQSLRRLATAITEHPTAAMLVYDGSEASVAGTALAPGVSAVVMHELLARLK